MKKNRLTINQIVKILLLVLSTTSCQDNTLYHSYQPVKSTGWEKGDTLVFSMPQVLVNHHYQYEIGIRHKDSYKYKDIWLKINQDTIHLYLTDNAGKWKGQGLGEILQLSSSIQLTFSQQDSIRDFHIQHIMQDSPLLGIHDIGLQIKKP